MLNDLITISVDAMGGANAPAAIIAGMLKVSSTHKNVKFMLFGDKQRLMPILNSYPELAGRYEVVHCATVVTDEQQPVQALKKGVDSSMRKAIDAVKEKKAHACVSCGNTGALMVMAKMVLGSIHGIARPAIVSIFPNFKGGVVMLDLGANAQCDAHNLFQFAIMGYCFAKVILKKANPSIGILNVGIEEYKGRDLDKKAADLLKNSELNFHGYIEGHDITEGTVDVVVTDGFSGNIVIKVAEGVASLCKGVLKETFNQGIFGRLAALLVAKNLKKVVTHFDPRNHNGAMFIGVDGIVVKSHGSSDATAFANALEVTINLAKQNINQQISELLGQVTEQYSTEGTIVDKIKKKLGL
jgi:glycerol-3-phosphate acyltransferase PlsX